VILSDQNGALLEFPIFSLFAKCFILELISFCDQKIINEPDTGKRNSDQTKSEEKDHFSSQTKLCVLDMLQSCTLSIFSFSRLNNEDIPLSTCFEDLLNFYNNFNSDHLSF
jgi:hypothetical protein